MRAVRHFGTDSRLRRWGLGLAARGGRAAKRKAVVAVARKLAILLHVLWKREVDFDVVLREEGRAAGGASGNSADTAGDGGMS